MLGSSDSAGMAPGQLQNAACSSTATSGVGVQRPVEPQQAQDVPERDNQSVRRSAASSVGTMPRSARHRHLHSACSQSGDSDDAAIPLSSFVRRWTLRGARFCPRSNSYRPASEPSSPVNYPTNYLGSRSSPSHVSPSSEGGTSPASAASTPGGDNEDGARFVLAVYRSNEMEQLQRSASTSAPADAPVVASREAGAAEQPPVTEANDC